MRVVVAGAGALGSLLGGYLARAGEEVVLIGREAHVAAIREGGLRVSGIWGEVTLWVDAVTDIVAVGGPADLVILGTKSQDSEAMLEAIRPIVAAHTQILTPQNGVANEDFVARLYGCDRSLPAVTSINVSLIGPGHIDHGAEEHIELGAAGAQDPSVVQAVVEAFNRAGFVASYKDDIMELKWWKLAVFCVGSILNALTGVQSLAEGDDLRELMRGLANEVVAVVEAGRLTPFPIRPVVDRAYHFFDTYRPANWRASLGQDLCRGKRTEIDYLNGYIVRLGRQYGVPTPVNHCIYTLVKTIEQTGYFKR